MLADYTYDWEYWIGTDGNYVYLSPSCERITGYAPEEFKANPHLLFEIVHPDFKEHVHKHYYGENNKETPIYSTEFPILTKKGELRWLKHNCSPVFDEENNFIGRRGNNRDITEAKITEKKIIESEERFKSIFLKAPFGIELYDKEGKLIKANQECLNIFGVTNIEEINDFKLFEDPNLSEEIKRKIKNGEIVDFETKFDFELVKKMNLYKTTRSGQAILHIQITPFKIPNSVDKEYVVHVHDITDKKNAEQELKISEEKFRNFFENNQAVMLEISPNTKKIINCNKKAIEFYGYNKKELLTKLMYEINVLSKKEMDEKMKSALMQASHFARFQHKLADNSIRDVDVYASPVTVKGVKNMFVLVLDITESLKNEEELEVYRNNLEILVKGRTEELETINEELSEANKKLEEFNDLFVGREFRIKELKEKNKLLEEELLS